MSKLENGYLLIPTKEINSDLAARLSRCLSYAEDFTDVKLIKYNIKNYTVFKSTQDNVYAKEDGVLTAISSFLKERKVDHKLMDQKEYDKFII